MTPMHKKELRSKIRCKTSAMSESQKEEEAQVVVNLLQRYISAQRVKVLAMFYPLNDEINILPLAYSALDVGCRVVMPRMESGEESRMEFYDFLPHLMAQGSLGVMEPVQGERVEASQIDLMIVPGVAFTPKGERMGRGKGYYDRYLSRQGFRAHTVGVCFAHQVVDRLPVEEHDKRVDRLFWAAMEEFKE